MLASTDVSEHRASLRLPRIGYVLTLGHLFMSYDGCNCLIEFVLDTSFSIMAIASSHFALSVCCFRHYSLHDLPLFSREPTEHRVLAITMKCESSSSASTHQTPMGMTFATPTLAMIRSPTTAEGDIRYRGKRISLRRPPEL